MTDVLEVPRVFRPKPKVERVRKPYTRKPLQWFFVEMTDTFSGEANYAWVNRFKVQAVNERGAILKVNRETGPRIVRLRYSDGETVRHDVQGANICFFTGAWEEEGHKHYTNVKVLKYRG